MTTPDLGHDPGAEDSLLGALFDLSPARTVHTSAAAGIALIAGLFAVLAAPFSLMIAMCLGLSVLGLVTSVVGMARAEHEDVSGAMLASLGMVFSLATLALVGLRYLGLDTAFGDTLGPTLADWLAALNDLVPSP